MTTRRTTGALAALFAGCGAHAARPARPTPPSREEVTPPRAASTTCQPLALPGGGLDPRRLALEVCTEPTGESVTVSVRRAADHVVLWSEEDDGFATAYLTNDDEHPGVQVVVKTRAEEGGYRDETGWRTS